MNTGTKIETFEDLTVWQQAIDLAGTTSVSLKFSANLAECRSLLASDLVIAWPEHVVNRLQASSYIETSIRVETAKDANLLSQKLGAYIKVRETRFS